MNALDEYAIQCPYCGEPLSLLIDRSDESRSYVEDCQVCCQPILLEVAISREGEMSVMAHQENE
ncbi:MAG: CPXCG motif-containing cysteine-rich protein [Gammaproteobacteria bacterium]|jgi:hypothetical protein|nr:CPXCG motif-containing cysteine-rich protein [Gammaproteobacteria bacterium]NIN61609.1 CPXCG motif-containing cysteine-rich protein [Gammaproteobacteria bacterium]NIO62803.1 CPXCG motif-containing cysteine-rich protein [Gammaproteobacteria bacterium]NIQ09558.1 CPXCG motif-containing cysteine-rich protein [Gammaproteobacteria bacterium]NIQ19367.1 CPXCG motif-containing cysteine-rich protein [Gammaproteobacteria bacterium]